MDDSTMPGRIFGVLDNDVAWYKYLEQPMLGGTAIVPLVSNYLDAKLTARDINKYNATRPQNQRLGSENNDKYFHQHAMYEAAHPGIWSALVAATMGELKELNDARVSRKEGKKTEAEIQAERKKDLKNNYDAIKMALKGMGPVDSVIVPNPTVQVIREKKKNGEI